MKRIGIVTFFSNCNYGSVLQAYALSNYLKQKGYNTEIIDYLTSKNHFNVNMRMRTIINRMSVLLKHPKILKETLKGKKKSIKSVKMLSCETVLMYKGFIEKYLKPFQGKYHHSNDFDAFICGSDQIWQISAPGLSDIFFLRFTIPKKRIAYAASLGSVSIPEYNAKRFKKYINEFSSISVRENASKKIIKDSCEKDVTHVLDPTLLVGKSFWEKIINDYETQDDYILCYFLDKNEGLENIVKLAKNNNLKVLWVETGIKNPEGTENISPSPFKFVSLIKNATFVISDSFHACCFSALFEKNFYIVRRNYQGYPAQHIRIEELLSILKMQDRQIDNCLTFNQLNTINKERYIDANERISKLRETSQIFLENALKNI